MEKEEHKGASIPTEEESAEDSAASALEPSRAEKPQLGPAVGIIIIIAVLVLGALYFWGAQLSRKPQMDQTTEALKQQSNSDEIAVIEQDLENTPLEDLDKELGEIDQELGL